MSDTPFEVAVVKAVVAHPNADRLEIVKVLGTQFVTVKGKFQAEDLCVYFPPDMLIPEDLAEKLGVANYLKHSTFPGDLQKSRCRIGAIRLRGTASFGFGITVGEAEMEANEEIPFDDQQLDCALLDEVPEVDDLPDGTYNCEVLFANKQTSQKGSVYARLGLMVTDNTETGNIYEDIEVMLFLPRPDEDLSTRRAQGRAAKTKKQLAVFASSLGLDLSDGLNFATMEGRQCNVTVKRVHDDFKGAIVPKVMSWNPPID